MFLLSSCSCLCPIYRSYVVCWQWRCSWSSADRRCSNYIWVINNLISHKGAAYIRDLAVYHFHSHYITMCMYMKHMSEVDPCATSNPVSNLRGVGDWLKLTPLGTFSDNLHETRVYVSVNFPFFLQAIINHPLLTTWLLWFNWHRHLGHGCAIISPRKIWKAITNPCPSLK